MRKLKKLSDKRIIICIFVLFIILSYFKFYTVRVSFSNDPTVSIVKTQDIQWAGNTYRIDKDTLPYNWYDDYKFKILYADEMGDNLQYVHSFIIILWWIMLLYMGFNLIKKISRKLNPTYKFR